MTLFVCERIDSAQKKTIRTIITNAKLFWSRTQFQLLIAVIKSMLSKLQKKNSLYQPVLDITHFPKGNLPTLKYPNCLRAVYKKNLKNIRPLSEVGSTIASTQVYVRSIIENSRAHIGATIEHRRSLNSTPQNSADSINKALSAILLKMQTLSIVLQPILPISIVIFNSIIIYQKKNR